MSVLFLANPSEDFGENEKKLKRVQGFLRESVKLQLQEACYGCVTCNYRHPVYSDIVGNHHLDGTSIICKKCGKKCPTNYPAQVEILSKAGRYANRALMNELSFKGKVAELVDQCALYKVVGSLYLLCQGGGSKQQLARQVKTLEEGESSGKLPCEFGSNECIKTNYFVTANPELSKRDEEDFILEPLKNRVGSSAEIAESVLSLCKEKAEGADAAVAIIDKEILEPLFQKYCQKKEDCVLI